MTIDHDGLFKELLTAFFAEFIELFASDILQGGGVASMTLTDTKAVHDTDDMGKNRADFVGQMRCADGSKAYFYVHVETQFQAGLAGRMLDCFARLRYMYRAPVFPIALLTFDERSHEEPNTVTVSFPDLDVLRFQFQKIHLRKLNWRDYRGHPNPVAAALMVKMDYERHERAQVKAECIRLLATLKLGKEKNRLIGRFVEAYLSLDTEETAEFNDIMEAIPGAKKQAVTEILTDWERLGLEPGGRL